MSAGMVSLPPETQRFVAASQLDIEFVKPIWDLAVLELDHEPSMASLARRLGGTPDTVANVSAVALPTDIYHDPMPQHTLDGSSPRRFYFAAAVLAALTCPTFLVDLPLARLDLHARLPGDVRRVLGWSELVAHGIGAAILAVVVLVLDPKRRRRIPRILASAYLAGLMANGVKLIVARVRPRVFDFQGGVWDTFVGWLPWLWRTRSEFEHGFNIQSFPSGHTATAVGLAIGLGWLYPRGRWLFLSFAVLAAMQRIEVGAHYLSDTVAAAALGCLAAAWVMDAHGLGRWFDRWEARSDKRVTDNVPPAVD